MPKAPRSTKDAIKDEIGEKSALEAVKNSEGGRILLSNLLTAIGQCIDELTMKYKSASHPELIVLSARLAEKVLMYRVINNSSKHKKNAIKDLEAYLAENPDE